MNNVKTTNSEAIKRLERLQGEHLIAVGLSGGVDSSLTAALLVEAGWEVEGLTLWLLKGQGSCCSDGLIDAAGICEQLGIKHHVVDARETFKREIIERLINGYQEGITPSPCSQCNRSVKFSEMLHWAKSNLNFKRVATGHYARIKYANDTYNFSFKSGNKKHKLLRGLDRNKDQSYFLYDLSQSVLENVVFPLGELTKEETREMASKYGLRTAQKPESQDLCLSEHHGSMKAFLDNYLPERKGEIVLKDGTLVGEHDGIEHFTIGQRRGLGVSWKTPLHVIKLDSSMNRVVVGPRAEAGKSSCTVGKVNWVSISPPEESIDIEVQLRYRSLPILASLTPIKPLEKDIEDSRPYRCEVFFKEEQFSITPGQAAVFYSGEVLLGGGLIEKD
ncbi:tRNA 2-thiouridine(34) synthase MnmA [Prochlorococcus sp. MIT 1223]|uniref:tRNA 2-thiouridine(34) synthase MnmA n=1 Tax=Prochlorococcus sp. MIT 1223 TaxID=3096217 RepID=UPI002A74C6EF|nr:tRNA 2-thiouridine(34) synthase MnmA [Prochlorococcus sp. MIT 1223]